MVKKLQSLLSAAAFHVCASCMWHFTLSFVLVTVIEDQISMMKKDLQFHKLFWPRRMSGSYPFANNDESGL